MAAIKEYYTIALHDTDAAGIIYFANLFRIVHATYERLLERIGYPLCRIIPEGVFLIPVVHAEADFHQPLTVGNTVEIALSIAAIGESSFTLAYRLYSLDGDLVGSAGTVHVMADGVTKTSTPLPPDFKNRLRELME